MLITISGLDGAGKSTLIERLQAGLERRGRRVAVRHMADDIGVYACLRSARDALLPAAARRNGRAQRPATGAPSLARRVRNAIIWNKPWRHLVYVVDLCLFWGYRLYLERARRQILIMDRYFYDTLVDVADGRHWRLLRMLQRLTPTPDVAVLLDVGPEESYARKRDYPVEYLRDRWQAYRTVFPWVRGALVIKNDDLHAAQQAVARVVGERLAA